MLVYLNFADVAARWDRRVEEVKKERCNTSDEGRRIKDASHLFQYLADEQLIRLDGSEGELVCWDDGAVMTERALYLFIKDQAVAEAYEKLQRQPLI